MATLTPISVSNSDLQTRVEDLETIVKKLTQGGIDLQNELSDLKAKYESIVQNFIKVPGDHRYYCMSCQDWKDIFFDRQVMDITSSCEYFNSIFKLSCPTCNDCSEEQSSRHKQSTKCSEAQAKENLRQNLIESGVLEIKAKAEQKDETRIKAEQQEQLIKKGVLVLR